MRASGDQLRQITALVDSGVLRPVVGRVFDFDQTVQAVQSLGKGGIRGKAVITTGLTQPFSPSHRPETGEHIMSNTDTSNEPVITSYAQAPGPHRHRRRRHLRLPRAGTEGRHPRRLLRPPRRDPGQLGPADRRPHRAGPPRHHLRQPRRRRLHRQVPDSVEAMADDAYTFIKALGFDKIDIFSFSLGGMIAQALVVKHPELVRKLVLTGTGPSGRQGHRQGRRHHLLGHPARDPDPVRTRRSSCSSTATPPASPPRAHSCSACRSAPSTATRRSR